MNQNKESFPELTREPGAIHPITQIKSEILSLLEQIGFAFIDGPEVETEKYNFDMLNIKKTHPARQMHDTFYVQNKDFVLRTHTSPVQIRGCLNKSLQLLFVQLEKFIGKMMTLLICLSFIKLRVFMLMKMNFTHLKSLIYKIVTSYLVQK